MDHDHDVLVAPPRARGELSSLVAVDSVLDVDDFDIDVAFLFVESLLRSASSGSGSGAGLVDRVPAGVMFMCPRGVSTVSGKCFSTFLTVSIGHPT